MIKAHLKAAAALLYRFRKWLLAGAAIGLVALSIVLLVCFRMIAPYSRYVVAPGDTAALRKLDRPVGVVLGAGVTKEGKPYKELQARLDTAADALNNGTVRKLVLSGDNRFAWYNEPQAMRDYLVRTRRIDPSLLQVDNAGRSTYESCDRLARVFGQKNKDVVIFSAASHLPRAIFLCRHFGVKAYGVSNSVEANNASRREALARLKAVFNVYIYGEQTIYGDQIML